MKRLDTMTIRFLPLAALVALTACKGEREPLAQQSETKQIAPASDSQSPAAQPASSTQLPPEHAGDPPPAPPRPDPAARTIALAEWRKSEQPHTCAPLALTSDAGAQGTARRAEFSGGWGVAFDQPGLRSAYGFAGTGFLPEDLDEVAAQRARLAAQWPYFRELAQLPKPSFAGYGIEGAKDYPADKPDGRGKNSIAYVRVAGQQCDYNVWSKLGRAHLEHLLEHLELLPTR